ncbi:MAG: hypothetical protein SGI72_09985 [Planctomycetota bacterium]|nr:hypothetical protein [Planctomycetota bacterium]
MKNTIQFCLALALAIPLAACSENKAGTSTMKDAADKVSAGVDSMKAEVSKMTEAPMAEAGKQISELQTKAANMTGEGKTKLEGMIKSITAKKDDIMKMMGDMKGADIKDKIMNNITELKKMITEAFAVK